MAVTNSNDSFISRLPESDRQAIADGNAARAADTTTTSAPSPAPTITHSSPREAVVAIHQYPPPSHTELAPLTYGQQEEALYSYNTNRAELAQDAINTYEPTRDQFSGLSPGMARVEYETAVQDYRNDPYVTELRRLRNESTENPYETPTAPPAINELEGFSNVSAQSGATGNAEVDEALDAVVVAQESYDSLVTLANNGNRVALVELRTGDAQATVAAAERELDGVLRDTAETSGDPRDRTATGDLTQVDEVVDSYQGGALGRQILEQAGQRVRTDIQVDDALATAERIDDPEAALDYLDARAEQLGNTAAIAITRAETYQSVKSDAEDAQRARAASDYAELPGDITTFHQFDELLLENVDDPAYLAELVRLGHEDGLYSSTESSINWLFDTDETGGYRHSDADIPEAAERRDAIAASIAAALDYGVLSEADIRDLGVGREGWQDVAVRIGLEQVGATDATQVTDAELYELQSTQASAQDDVQALDEQLAGFLAQAGPLTPEQQAAFVEAYRSDPENKEAYDSYYEATEALATYVSENQTAILDASVRDPYVAQRTADVITTLAQNGHGVEALELIGAITATPDSAEAVAFAEFPDLVDQTLIDASTSAASQLLAQHDGDAQAANQAFQSLVSPIAQGLPAGMGRRDLQLGYQLLDQYARGDFSNIEVYTRQFDTTTPAFRALAGAGVIFGSASAFRAGTEGDYINAIAGFANSGENGLRLVAGAANSLTDTGRISQYAGRFAGSTGFAARLAPGLGLIANSASLVNSLQHAADGNLGYALASVGDIVAVLGSAIELIPGGQPVGFVVSGIGVLISSVGSVIGELINSHERYEQIEGYLIEAGVDPEAAHDMARTGRTLGDVAERLNLSPEQVQTLASDHADLRGSSRDLRAFADAAEAFGLSGSDVLDFANALAEDSGSIGDDLFYHEMRQIAPAGQSDEGAALRTRELITENFPTALEFLQSASPELFTAEAVQRDAAARDFDAIILNGYGDERTAANLLADNPDSDYRSELVSLIDTYYGGVERFAADLAIGSTGKQLNAAYDAIVDAVNAGVIDGDAGIRALEFLE